MPRGCARNEPTLVTRPTHCCHCSPDPSPPPYGLTAHQVCRRVRAVRITWCRCGRPSSPSLRSRRWGWARVTRFVSRQPSDSNPDPNLNPSPHPHPNPNPGPQPQPQSSTAPPTLPPALTPSLQQAGLCLYGNDLDDSTSPAEGTLLWVVAKCRRTPGGFVGSERILSEIANKSATRKRCGFVIPKGAPAREGSAVFDAAGVEVGVVTSGGYSPCLKKGVGMCYVPPHLMKAGTELSVEVRAEKQQLRFTPCLPATPAALSRLTPPPPRPPLSTTPGPWQEAAAHRHQDALRALQLLPRPLSAGCAVSAPGRPAGLC